MVLARYAVQKRGSIVNRGWSCALRPRVNLLVAQHALGDLSCLCYCQKVPMDRGVLFQINWMVRGLICEAVLAVVVVV